MRPLRASYCIPTRAKASLYDGSSNFLWQVSIYRLSDKTRHYMCRYWCRSILFKLTV